MHNLKKVTDDCIRECQECGIVLGKIADISIDDKPKRYWGLCRYSAPEKLYYIIINPVLLEDKTPIKFLKETILHELCHTIKGGMAHTGAWKTAVEKLNRKFGYNIKRVNTNEDKGVDNEDMQNRAKYVFQCKDCGSLIYRFKASNFTKNYDCYVCGKCGGKFKKIKG
jgi:predicted SprT family Zn-dependent metalloprotease